MALFIIATHAAMAQSDVHVPSANAAPPLTLSAALRSALDTGSAARNQALDDVFVVVSLAYFDAVLARQQVDLALKALERVAQAKAVNQALHQAGRLAQAELELEQARNGVLTADSALLQLLGPEWAQRSPGTWSWRTP